MSDHTVAQLMSDAAKRLRDEFEFIRTSNPHSGDKGTEAEDSFRKFLNDHLPKRFVAAQGYVMDISNRLSRQEDVFIYDAMSSPVYRAGGKTQIVPVDTVAAVIEVKSVLTKKELIDAYEKITSCKALKKTPIQTGLDQPATASPLASVATLGAIFAFRSSLKTETVAKHILELNSRFPSELWPDIIGILDDCAIDYGVGHIGEPNLAGAKAPTYSPDSGAPPFYIYPTIHRDGKLTLNRFFYYLLAHLSVFPRRLSLIPPDLILQGASSDAQVIAAYQYDSNARLQVVPPSLYQANHPQAVATMDIYSNPEMEEFVGRMEYLPWQDGAVMIWIGSLPLAQLIPVLVDEPRRFVIPHSDGVRQLTQVLRVSLATFLSWPERLVPHNLHAVSRLVD